MSYMQFRSVGWARLTLRIMRRLDTYSFVGDGCRNRLPPMVVLHHSDITQRVAEVMTSPPNKIKGFMGKPLLPMIHDGPGSRKRW